MSKVIKADTKLPLGNTDQYPCNIQIGDCVWSLKFAKQIEGDYHWGLCEPNTKTIYIKRKQPKAEKLKTFIHESIHAMETEYQFTLPHADVERLEVAMTAFLTDNFNAIHRIMLGD